MAALYDSLNAVFTQIANDVKLLFSSKANKNGETFTGPITISSTAEAQVHVSKSSQPTAYLYSNDNAWGLYSSAGGEIIGYNRTTTKTLVGGIDTSEIVRNNAGTYNINISASAAKLNGQTASYYTDIPTRLGYTPVQQGTGIGQSANPVKIGWSGSAKLKVTVDNTDLGNIAFEPWVSQQIANLVASSPAALDTLNEFAIALGNDPNFATTITNALAGKAAVNGTYAGLTAGNSTTAQFLNTANDQRVNSLGVGTPAAGTAGDIRATGDIRGFFSSDKRLKENIACIEFPLEIVDVLRGVRFDWTDAYIEENGGIDEYFLRKEDIGVIADDVEKVLPELVSIKNNGYKAVKYDRLVAVLIEAVKALNLKSKQSDATVIELKEMVKMLSEKITQIENKLS